MTTGLLKRYSPPPSVYILKGGEDMKRIDNFPFYELGAAIVPLQDLTSTTKIADVAWPVMRAQFALRGFLDETVIVLSYSIQTARELNEQLNRIIPVADPVPAITAGQEIGYPGNYIAMKAKTFEHELAAELRQLDTYFIPAKGIFSTAKLMQRTDEMFEPDIRNYLTDQVKMDIREAGKCIACELGTQRDFILLERSSQFF